ncbi:retrovirus-related pol polyprotein from transposon TNT 1-94 [Tanacetum coccineum]|uniref:Retrovirus-related pol polyprotein from transposon TNT 1-94 n=1 Tax=Tanacetum coccineum TaxID=301880 RepID=A0ABQ5A9M5_9ASTR
MSSSNSNNIKKTFNPITMTTLVEFMILSGGDNRPLMLDKDLYDSWQSRMELYMENKEHGRMILKSVKHGPLIWPTIEENYVTRTKKYVELSATEKIQADCDLNATNIILHGLPSDVYSLINHHRVAKDLWERVQLLMQYLHITNFDQLNTFLEQHELHANEVRNMRERNQDPLALVTNHQMTPYHFNTYQSSYNNPQFQQQFSLSQSPQYGSIHPTQHYSTTYLSTPLAINYPSASLYLAVLVFKQGDDPIDAINKMMGDKVHLLLVLLEQGQTSQEKEGLIQLIKRNDLGSITYDSDCDEISIAKAVLMANLSSYGSDVLSEVPHSENTHNDMLNQSVQEISYSKQTHLVNYPENEISSDSNIIPYSQYLLETQYAAVYDTNSSVQQDAMILSVFEQLSNQVTNCNKVNKDNLMANESLSAELERYKEQFADFEKEINYLKQTLSEQLKEKELLTKTFNVLKNESKEKEARNIDKEIALEKKVKELDNIVYKMGQSAQRPMLYDSTIIAKETNVISISDSGETLMLEEESRSKMLLKQSDPMVLEKKVNIKPVNYAVLNQLSEDFDIVNIVVNSSVDLNTSMNVNSSVAMNDSVNYVEKCNKCLELEAELIKQHNMVEKDEKLKGKDIGNNVALVSNATTIAQGMYKLDPVTLAPKDKNNREAHIYYLKHTMEQVDILKEIVEQAKSLNPLNSASYSACKYVKLIQELLAYVRDTCPHIHKPSEKLVVVTPINKKKAVSSMFYARHELCFLEFVSDMNACSKSKPVKKAKNKKEWKPTGKVFTKIGYNWRPIGRTFTLVGNARPKVPKTIDSNSKPKIAKSMTSNKMKPGTSRGSNTSVASTSSSLVNDRLSRLFSVRFRNDQITKIMRYGDYQLGNVIISRVYYVEGLGHNLFSVGQFCDADLEVVFQKNTCFIRNLEGVNLLSGSKDTNLYTISLDDMLKTSLIYLLSKALKTKSWLWHRWLSHLNFGKGKKSSHQPTAEDTNQEKLYLFHMDLCGPMRVESINGKRYILVIIDDYSRFTLVKFLRSNDEAPNAIIKCIKNIQVRLNDTVHNVRIDNGTEFVNQTLRDFYENVRISHQTFVAHTPQQNGIVERRN